MLSLPLRSGAKWSDLPKGVYSRRREIGLILRPVPRGEHARILVIDDDLAERQKVALAMDAAGLLSDTSSFNAEELGQKRAVFEPNLLFVRAEVGAPTLTELMRELERQSHPLPIVLLCQDMRDAPYVRHMRTGLVEMLQLPFSPRLHIARLRLLPTELPARLGHIKGQGAHRELSLLIGHLVKAERTGELTLNKGVPDEGLLTFSKGVLKKTRLGTLTGEQALARVKGLQQANWDFEEGADSTADAFELGGAAAPIERNTPAAAEPSSAEPSRGPDALNVAFSMPPPPPPQLPGMPQASAIDLFGSSVEPPPPSAPALSFEPAASMPTAPSGDEAQSPILFVDDDATLVQMFSTFFTKKGYPTTTADDGIDGYQKLLAGHFELVIVDLNMPRLDGWGFLRVVREDFRTLEMPVAVFSNHDNYREQLRALHAGAQAYYGKSLKMAALEAQVKELLEPRRRFTRVVLTGQSVVMPLGALGMQWVLRKLADLRVTGQLDAQDAWASYRLQINGGQLAQATAKAGPQTLNGERALMMLLAARGVEGSLLRQADMSAPAGVTTEALLAKVVAVMNDEQQKLKEEQLKQAKGLDINNELYQLYTQVGPPAWKPAVQLLCEAKLLPRDVMSRLSMSAAELSAVLKDLVRRGVVALKS